MKLFSIFIPLLIVLVLAACGEGSQDSADAGNQSHKAGHHDTEPGDSGTAGDASADSGAAGDATADAGACTQQEPRCEGEVVVTCENGQETHTPCGAGTFCNYGACATSRVHLPKDAAPHDCKTEWWYYTGHVADGDQKYGFEVTIFKYNLSVFKGYMCHVAVLDATAGVHYHTDEVTPLPDVWTSSPIVLGVGSCRFELGGLGHDRFQGAIAKGKEKDNKGAPWTIDLKVDPQKRPALHGDGGYIPMSNAGGTSWYYSYTRLKAAGAIKGPSGVVHPVSGIAWMDHQWGPFDPLTEFKGWDWWSMQLDDNYEIMLFRFRNWQNVLVTQAGTIMDPDGNQVTFDGLDSFTVTSHRTWTSPYTNGIYPLDWDIPIVEGDWDLSILVGVDDQEMHNLEQNYWEGATTITGTRGATPVTGVGYTELTGYAKDLFDPK